MKCRSASQRILREDSPPCRVDGYFFDRPNGGADARSVGQATIEALGSEARDLTVLIDQSVTVHFFTMIPRLRACCIRGEFWDLPLSNRSKYTI